MRTSVMAAFLLCVARLAVAQATSDPTEWRSVLAKDGTEVRYAIVLPDGFDGAKAYPTLLAFPPGDEGEEMVRRGLGLYWRAEAKRRGWVVVSPSASAGRAFHDAGAALIPDVLDDVARSVHFENGLVHVAGASNGGRAAFRAAIDSPGRYASLVALPGVPPAAADFARLDRLKNVPVVMLVGLADNEYWVAESRRTAERLRQVGADVTLRELAGQGHVLGVPPAELFDAMDLRRPAARATALARDAAKATINRLLDDFHDAAAKADEDRYFAHFAPGAVFLGTDATERWTAEEFKVWAMPYFQRDTAWTYTPRRRWVSIAPGGDAAWFDEVLDNAKLGECRGSGVLVKIDGAWRITQYNLTVPVPNDLMAKVVEMIRQRPAGSPTP